MKAAVGEEGEGLAEDDNKSPDQMPVKDINKLEP